jgi:TetR/AcrR family transcriptional repressor of nem operon
MSQIPSARTRILDSALHLIRERGYAATTVDDLCAEAGVTKGGFFHHFKGKEEMAVAATGHFAAMADRLFSHAPYHALEDPLDRVLGYLDFRIALLGGELWRYTCLLGTLVQETYASNPAIRTACDQHITGHAQTLACDIALAREYYVPNAPWTAESLALHSQAVIQGSFVLAKARNGDDLAADSLRHLRRYVELLFHVPSREETIS